MNVYLLIHDDREYDMGDTYVRGVYQSSGDAEAAVVTRTASGARSRAYEAHDEHCCSVAEREILTATVPDAREDDPLVPQTGGAIIPESFIESYIRTVRAKSPLRIDR